MARNDLTPSQLSSIEEIEHLRQQLAQARKDEQLLREDLHKKDQVLTHWKNDDAKLRAENNVMRALLTQARNELWLHTGRTPLTERIHSFLTEYPKQE